MAGTNVAVIGDYRDDGSLMLGSLDDLGALEKTHLAMPDGGRVPRGRLVCRGSVAHLFVGAAWLVFDLTEVL